MAGLNLTIYLTSGPRIPMAPKPEHLRSFKAQIKEIIPAPLDVAEDFIDIPEDFMILFMAEMMTDEIINGHEQFTEADRPLLMAQSLHIIQNARSNPDIDGFPPDMPH